MSTNNDSNRSGNKGYTPINELGEFGLIDHLTQAFSPYHDSTRKGVGDDAAVIKYEDDVVVWTTDYLVEAVHFDMVYTPLKHLGYKAVVACISDVYAMNAHPQQITVSLAISNKYPVEALDELYQGIELACNRYKVDIVGGDTTTALKGMVINMGAIGTVKEENVTYRDRAQEGDVVCVTGDLGGAYIGLLLLEREKEVFMENPEMQPNLEGQDYVVGRMLKPEARKDIVELFSDENIIPNAMIDVSDGVSSDILHICDQSGVGCLLDEDNFPIDPNTYQKALDFNMDPTLCFLNGGEDYELLFTVDDDDFQKIENSPDVTKIGEIREEGEGTELKTKSDNIYPLKAQGWDPIRKKDDAQGSA